MANYPRIEVNGIMTTQAAAVLSPGALDFIVGLHHEFNGKRKELLDARKQRHQEIVAGKLPDFLSQTKNVRDGDWKIAPIPKDLEDRRVEITGPVDRKRMIMLRGCSTRWSARRNSLSF